MYTTPDGTLHIPIADGRLSRHWWAQTEITLPAGTFLIQPHPSGDGISVGITDAAFAKSFHNVAEVQITRDGRVIHYVVNATSMDEYLES